MKLQSRNNTRFIFALLGLYVLVQFLWWANLLIRYNPVKMAMVLGEGAVFLALLALGVYKIYVSVQHEIELARVQKNFMLSITHELKTPVAATQLFLQTLQRHELDAERKKEIIEKALQENARLNFLIDNLLLATSLESRGFPLHFRTEDLSMLVQRSISKFKDTLARYHRWDIQVQEGVTMQCDLQAMSSIIDNLLENAVKYSPPGSKITVSLVERGGKITLAIADEGIGIQKGHEQKIFEKFFRSGNEEIRATKGTGLGLYIVKNLVGLHGGSIACIPNQSVGTIFKLIFNS